MVQALVWSSGTCPLRFFMPGTSVSYIRLLRMLTMVLRSNSEAMLKALCQGSQMIPDKEDRPGYCQALGAKATYVSAFSAYSNCVVYYIWQGGPQFRVLPNVLLHFNNAVDHQSSLPQSYISDLKMLREVAYGLAGLAFIAFAIDFLFRLRDDPREPPRLGPKVPLIGHVIGMMQYGSAYYNKTRLGSLPHGTFWTRCI